MSWNSGPMLLPIKDESTAPIESDEITEPVADKQNDFTEDVPS